MAESNAALNRSLHLHRDTQFAAAAIYQQLYGHTDQENGGVTIPATFQVRKRSLIEKIMGIFKLYAPYLAYRVHSFGGCW